MRPVAGLDRTDYRLLKRLNEGRVTPRMAFRNRIDQLLQSGFVAEKSFGEVAITPRGQLELARWRFRKLPKSRYVIVGPVPSGGSLFERIFKTS